MSVWDAYLLLLRRFGLSHGPPPQSSDGTVGDLPAINWLPATSVDLQTNLWRWIGLPVGGALALLGQWLLDGQSGLLGTLLLICGTALFIFEVWRLGLAGRGATESAGPQVLTLPGLEQEADVMPVRWQAIILAYLFTGLTFLLSAKNDFNVLAQITWVASLVLWVITFWEGSLGLKPERVREWFAGLGRKEASIRLSRTAILFLLIMVVAGWFRFGQLDEVPIAMTSDHVEKLIDVNDILNNGKRPIFEASNGGREPMEFYLAAFAAWAFNLGLTHLTLKVVTSVAGYVAIPFIFLLAREVSDDDTTALLAAAVAAISWWPNVISRNGLRFPFAMLFSAIALWLIIRALKRNSQNTLLIASVLLGIGLYGYTPIRIVPAAVGLAFAVYALHHLNRGTVIKAVAWFAMFAMILLAAFMPMIRYAVDEPANFWRRTATRITGEPGFETAPATVQVLLSNEWNSLRMFQWTSDSAWLISPANQPALDWVMGALFFIGVGVFVYRYVRYRYWVDLFIVLVIPLLLLPSTLALAFPIENPSLHRSGAAIPVVFIFVAVSLRIIWDYAKHVIAGRWGRAVGAGAIALLLLISAQENWTILFVRYANQYKSSVQNAPELGQEVQAWAGSVGDWDTVVVKSYPYWVDTRAVGYYAGKPGWNNVALELDNLDDLLSDPRPKLYILHHDDADAITYLRQVYPAGRLAYHISEYLGKDFLTFMVPGTLDFDESLLRAP